MSLNDVSVVLVHGAWADGSSWSKVIGPLRAEGIRVVAAPLPLTVVRFFDTGHFALETHAAEIAAAMREFLIRHV